MKNKPFALLIKDHEKVKDLIQRLLQTSASAKSQRRELLGTLKGELELHEKLEEQLLYPPLEHKKATRDLTLEAYEEHHVVDMLLDELEALDFDDQAWKAKLTVLQENLEHHIAEEEQGLFPKAQETLSAQQLERIEREIADAKKAPDPKR